MCDNNLHILGILGLDDSSHNSKDRKDGDTFVDEILTSVGYAIIHTRGVTDDTLDVFKISPKIDQC